MAPFAISGLPSPYTETQLVICILTESFKWIFCWNRKFLHMWRNFRCLHMTDVEKSENLHIWHVCDVENVTIYTKFMLFSWKNQFCQNLRTLSRNPFCRNLRTFVWRKIYPKKFYVEKKWQIWGLFTPSKKRKKEIKMRYEARRPDLIFVISSPHRKFWINFSPHKSA